MSYPPQAGKHSYDLEIDDDAHWKLVQIGAVFKMDHETFAEYMIETSMKNFRDAEDRQDIPVKADDHLYFKIQSELDLYGSMWPPKIALIFEFLANIIEQRGAKDLDRDPGETADWLRQEAKKVLASEESTFSKDEKQR